MAGKDNYKIPYGWIAVYPVLAAFANVDRIAWPSLQTIGILTGMDRAKSVKEAIASMIESGWIEEVRERQPKQRSKGLAFRLRSIEGYSSFAIGRDFVKNGAWATLTQSARIVWAILKASSWSGWYYFSAVLEYDDNPQECGIRADFDNQVVTMPTGITLGHGDFTFLPVNRFARQLFYSVATRIKAMTTKTFANAINELADKRIIYPAGVGFIITHTPGYNEPAVLERLAKAKTVNAAIAPGIKRTLNRLTSRSKNAAGN